MMTSTVLKKSTFQNFSHLNALGSKGVRALRGYFGPLLGQKIKVALHKFLLISLLGQKPKCKGLVLI